MPNTLAKAASLLLIAGGGLLLSACTVSRLSISKHFGEAVQQDIAVQVADPDPAYKGLPAPGALGSRVDLAQVRYATGTVIKPASASTTTVGPAGGSSGQ